MRPVRPEVDFFQPPPPYRAFHIPFPFVASPTVFTEEAGESQVANVQAALRGARIDGANVKICYAFYHGELCCLESTNSSHFEA